MNIKTSQTTYIETHHENINKRSLQRHILYRMLNHPHNTKPYIFVCMPGLKCWEIDYLWRFNYKTYKGIGPGVAKIIALEQDLEVFEKINQKYKGSDFVEVLNMSTTEFLYYYEHKVDIIYFDYYSNFSSKIKQDIEIMFERKVLNEKGKFITNFLGARESKNDQIMQKRLFDNLMDNIDHDLKWENIDEDTRRCAAFNGLIGMYRRKSITNRTYDRKNNNYVNTTAPLWFRYKNNAGHSMLTGYFTLNAYKSKQSGSALRKAREVWSVTKQWSIADWCKDVSSSENSKDYRALLIDEVKSFYEKNHHTPASRHLKRAHIKHLPGVIKELGLCPLWKRTKEDIKGEIDRIYDRDKVIYEFNLSKAKIALKYSNDTIMPLNEIIEYCEEKGYPNRFHLRTIKAKINHLKMLNSYIDHLQAKKNPSSYPQYGSIHRILNKDTSFQNAHNERIKLQDSLLSLGFTKDGDLAVQYTDNQLIDLFYNKNITVRALASLRLMTLEEMTKYLQSLGVDTSSRVQRNKKRITPSKVIKEIKNLKSITEIAVKYNVSSKYIKDILTKQNIGINNNGACIKLNKESVIQDYTSGMHISKVAKKHNVSSWSIRRCLKAEGVFLRGGKKEILPMEDIIKDYIDGLSMLDLSKKYEVGYSLIMNRIKKSGVKIRSQREALEMKKKLKLKK